MKVVETREENLMNELARLQAHISDPVQRAVLAHFIEQVPDEVEFHTQMQREKGGDVEELVLGAELLEDERRGRPIY